MLYSTLIEKAKLLKDAHPKLLKRKRNIIRYFNPKINELSLDVYDHEIDVDVYDETMRMCVSLLEINFQKTNNNLIVYRENYQGFDDIIIVNLESIHFNLDEEIDEVEMTLKYGRLQITDLQENTISKIPELISEGLIDNGHL